MGVKVLHLLFLTPLLNVPEQLQASPILPKWLCRPNYSLWTLAIEYHFLYLTRKRTVFRRLYSR